MSPAATRASRSVRRTRNLSPLTIAERVSSSIDLELSEGWRRAPGIFVIAEVGGAVGERIRQIQRQYDPKLANALPPHVTIAGSSGVGPIAADTAVVELRARLQPICRDTAVLELPLQHPHRFMQTDIIVLPIDPYGPIRPLYERIAASGLRFAGTKHTFTPHVTLSFYRTLEPDDARRLLAMRIEEPLRITSVRCSLTDEPMPPRTLLELPLGTTSPPP